MIADTLGIILSKTGQLLNPLPQPIRKFYWESYVLLERTLGVLVGQRCDLCREFTAFGVVRDDINKAYFTWCAVCTASEMRRHGL